MDLDTLGFALAAGMVAAVNPCGFAMLPAYLTLIVGNAVLRALAATALMALGFVLVFGTFGLVIAPLGAEVQACFPAVTVLIGLIMAALGVWMLLGREIRLPRLGKGAPTTLASMFTYGLAYAIVSLSCTLGPFLAVTSATFRSGSVLTGIAAYAAYGLGMALVVGVLAVSVALAGAAVTTKIRRILPYVHRIGGAILLVAGLYVGYYGIYELRLYHANGSAEDPIVDGAGRIQTVLASWVDWIGPLPVIIALVVLVAGAVALKVRRTG
ncbi:cytochrome c biogenesis CcdA family protein [Actinocrispum sp. NPDC049592]|uniref:cytochrome c biogenesis CcdA family protein n=1 Tax=Actinocrispum sp. NPDC049592 TaxID=3154835 RepID=UPI00341D7354